MQVHNNLCEEERIKLLCALDYDKLSAKSLNSNFPTSTAAEHGVDELKSIIKCRQKYVRLGTREPLGKQFLLWINYPEL